MEKKKDDIIKKIKNRIQKQSVFQLKPKVFQHNKKRKIKKKKEKSSENLEDPNTEKFSNKIKLFIKYYSKDNFKIVPFISNNPRTRSKEAKKNIKYSWHRHEQKIIKLIGTDGAFSILLYRNKENSIFSTIFKTISTSMPVLLFSCKNKECKGSVRLNYRKGTIEETREHIPSCHTEAKKLSSRAKILESYLSNTVNICLGITQFDESKNIIYFRIELFHVEPEIENKKELRVTIKANSPITNTHRLRCKPFFNKYLGKDKFLDYHYKRDSKGNIYAYMFSEFNVNEGLFRFICANEHCNCKAFYNFFRKSFIVKDSHISDCTNNIINKKNQHKKIGNAIRLFNKNKNITDIQYIEIDKK